jgi:hypothetical protein
MLELIDVCLVGRKCEIHHKNNGLTRGLTYSSVQVGTLKNKAELARTWVVQYIIGFASTLNRG